eukprot:scaffold1307_cov200-Pinguiococcus_pyrenoidosus.AAC.145
MSPPPAVQHPPSSAPRPAPTLHLRPALRFMTSSRSICGPRSRGFRRKATRCLVSAVSIQMPRYKALLCWQSTPLHEPINTKIIGRSSLGETMNNGTGLERQIDAFYGQEINLSGIGDASGASSNVTPPPDTKQSSPPQMRKRLKRSFTAPKKRTSGSAEAFPSAAPQDASLHGAGPSVDECLLRLFILTSKLQAAIQTDFGSDRERGQAEEDAEEDVLDSKRTMRQNASAADVDETML